MHLSRYVTTEAAAPCTSAPAARTAPDSDSLAAFLELVDCDPNEVQDATITTPAAPPAVRMFDAKRFGDRAMPFGKHKGQRIRNVPRNYLGWLAEAVGESNDVAAFKQDLRRWLAGEETQPTIDDALSLEYRSIIGPPQQRSA